MKAGGRNSETVEKEKTAAWLFWWRRWWEGTLYQIVIFKNDMIGWEQVALVEKWLELV